MFLCKDRVTELLCGTKMKMQNNTGFIIVAEMFSEGSL